MMIHHQRVEVKNMDDYLVPVSFMGPWTMRNMMLTMTTEITLVLSGYHARGLEAIPAKCAVGGIFILYTLS